MLAIQFGEPIKYRETGGEYSNEVLNFHGHVQTSVRSLRYCQLNGDQNISSGDEDTKEQRNKHQNL